MPLSERTTMMYMELYKMGYSVGDKVQTLISELMFVPERKPKRTKHMLSDTHI